MSQTQVITQELTFEVARSRADLEAAFQLVYHAYLRAGLVLPRLSELRITPYHLLPTTEVVVAKLQETVVSTVSLIGDGELGLPMELMYSEQVNSLRNQNLRLAEVGSLADRRKEKSRFLRTFFDMTRLLAQIARARGIDALVAAVHPRHAGFYRQLLGFKDIGDLTDCPYAQNRPAVALCLNFHESHDNPHYSRYFGTAIDPKILQKAEWDLETLEYFQPAVDVTMLPVDTY